MQRAKGQRKIKNRVRDRDRHKLFNTETETAFLCLETTSLPSAQSLSRRLQRVIVGISAWYAPICSPRNFWFGWATGWIHPLPVTAIALSRLLTYCMIRGQLSPLLSVGREMSSGLPSENCGLVRWYVCQLYRGFNCPLAGAALCASVLSAYANQLSLQRL